MKARNPQFSTDDGNVVNLEIEHALYGWVPFSATPSDAAQLGRDLFARALAGDFGPIAQYAGPSQTERLSANARAERDARLAADVDPIVSNPLRWGSLTPESQQAWREYRRALLDVTGQDGFPGQISWPTKPL